MTAYSVRFIYSASLNGSSQTIYSAAVTWALRAGDRPVKILVLGANGAETSPSSPGFTSASVSVRRFSAASISGGTALTPTACREGGVPASSTVRYQPVTYNASTGSFSPGSAVSVSGGGSGVELAQLGQSPWTPITETVIAPGSVLRCSAFSFYTSGSSAQPFITGFEVYFDEEPVSRSS